MPIEQGGQPNLGLIYSGDLTLTCEKTAKVSLVTFLGGTTPNAEDGGVAASGKQAQGGASNKPNDSTSSQGIKVPTRIETGAGGAAPGA